MLLVADTRLWSELTNDWVQWKQLSSSIVTRSEMRLICKQKVEISCLVFLFHLKLHQTCSSFYRSTRFFLLSTFFSCPLSMVWVKERGSKMCRVHVDTLQSLDIVQVVCLCLNAVVSNEFSLEFDKQIVQLVGVETENDTAVGCEKMKRNPENLVSVICLLWGGVLQLCDSGKSSRCQKLYFSISAIAR